MALGTVDPRPQEQLGGVVGLMRQVAHRAIPDHRRVLIDRALGGDDVAHELVVGHVGGEGVANPGVEGEGAALLLLLARALVAQQVAPLHGPEVGVFVASQKLIDQPARVCSATCRPGRRGPRRASASVPMASR